MIKAVEIHKSSYNKYSQIPIIVILFLLFSFEFDFSWRGNVTTAIIKSPDYMDLKSSWKKDYILLQAWQLIISGIE